MLELTFAEQVKLVLGRKGMTIKQLAEEIEVSTGMKMSRQNLTQRLGRNNFQEQDMKMIAEILECPYHLSILGDSVEAVSEVREVKAASKDKDKSMVLEPEEVAPVEAAVIEPAEVVKEAIPVVEEEVAEEKVVSKPALEVYEPYEPINKREVTIEEVSGGTYVPTAKSKAGDINPYSGYEYKTNSVRSHPHKIGYVQVYSRDDHQWTEMTEWAFFGYQERQKLAMGKEYVEPTYLD